MVYFNCAGCGNGLKKNQIQQHMYACNSRVFSCIDCNKDFKNDEYKMHTRCITESEKYESKSSYVAKANKGDVKQNAWLEKVNQAVACFKGSSRARGLLEKLVDFPNVPRKKAKFFNFAKNSFRSFGVNDSLLDEIWNVIDSFNKKEQQQQQQQSSLNNKNINNDNKRKLASGGEEEEEQVVKKIKSDDDEGEVKDETIKFDWIDLIRGELIRKETRQISLAKLSKKIYKKYKNLKHDDDTHGQLEYFNRKLVKKLKKNSSLFQLETTDAATLDSNNFESITVLLNE